jgi:hypothetical protein
MRFSEFSDGIHLDPASAEYFVTYNPDTIPRETFGIIINQLRDLNDREIVHVNGGPELTPSKAYEVMMDSILDRIEQRKRDREKHLKHGWEAGPYGKEAKLVPVWWLKRLKGNDLRDRMKTGFNPDSGEHEESDNIQDLANSMKNRGVQEPITIIVGWKDGYAYIGEGNHRVAAAELAGLTELPARVYMYQQAAGSRGHGSYTHNVAKDLTFAVGDYKAQYLTNPYDVFKSLNQ